MDGAMLRCAARALLFTASSSTDVMQLGIASVRHSSTDVHSFNQSQPTRGERRASVLVLASGQGQKPPIAPSVS